MDQTNRSQFRTALVYFIAFAALGLSPAILGPTLPGMADQVGATLQQIGIIFTSRSLGYLIGSMVAGRLYDRMKGHPILAAGFLGMGLTTALVPMSPTLTLLTALFFLQGVVSAIIDVGGNTLIIWLYQERVAPYLNALHTTFGAGASSAPLAVALSLSLTDHFAWSYYGIALFTLPVALLVLTRVSPQRIVRQEHTDRPALSKKALAIRVAFFVLYAGCEMGMAWWIYTYALKLDLMDEQHAAFLTSGFWIALTIGRLLSIFIARKWAPRQYLPLLFAGVIFNTILLWAGDSSAVLIWAATIGMGLSMSSIFPSMLSFTGRHFKVSASTNGWFFAGASTGSMTFPWLIGYLFEPIGPSAMPLVMGINLVLACTLLLYMIRSLPAGKQ